MNQIAYIRQATSYTRKERDQIMLAASKQIRGIPRKPVYYCTYLVLFRGVHKHEVYSSKDTGPDIGITINGDTIDNIPRTDINFWIAVPRSEHANGSQLFWLNFNSYAHTAFGSPDLDGIIKSKAIYKRPVVRQLFAIVKRAGFRNSVSLHFKD